MVAQSNGSSEIKNDIIKWTFHTIYKYVTHQRNREPEAGNEKWAWSNIKLQKNNLLSYLKPMDT